VEYGRSPRAVALDKALAARKDELRDVKIRATTRIVGVPEVVRADPTAEHFAYHNLHFSGVDRKLHDQGLCWFVPILYHEVPRYYRENCQVDVAMLPTAPMNQDGYFNFSLSNSFSRAICDRAKTVILEVNPALPVCLGGREESVHISEVDFVVEADWNIPELPAANPNEVDKKIAGLIMGEIEDGSCLQLGIGGMPVGSIRPAGLMTWAFTEMFATWWSWRNGARDRRQKHSTDSRSSTPLSWHQTAYNFQSEPRCAPYAVDYTNDLRDRAERRCGHQLRNDSAGLLGVVGHTPDREQAPVDFTYGAYRSRGGKAFLCMSSTYDRQGTVVSRIKPLLTEGAIVTVPRSFVSYVVTEHGKANLKGMSTWQRAEAIISLAHPAFREYLIKGAEKLGIWRRGSRARWPARGCTSPRGTQADPSAGWPRPTSGGSRAD
jgi:acyl-CoA hydrolase